MAQLKEGSVIKKATGDEVIATVNDMPSKVSELENDSGFAQLEDGKIASSQIPCTRGNVTILSDSNTVTIPFTPSDSAKLMVYQNGLLLSETIHYTVSGATLTLVNYTAEVGDVFQFIII